MFVKVFLVCSITFISFNLLSSVGFFPKKLYNASAGLKMEPITLPKAFGELHPKYRTPYKANWILFIFVGLFAAFVPGHVAGDLTSFGTLFAFVLVSAGVWILRKHMSDMNSVEAMEFLQQQMKGTRTNEEFLVSMNR